MAVLLVTSKRNKKITIAAIAAVNLFRKLNADVVGCAFLVDLPDLGGADKLRALDVNVTSLCAFSGH